MCDVMPTISEDSVSQTPGQFTANGEGFKDDAANFEQLMVNILVERDKLMETLRETQDQLNSTRNKLNELEKEKEQLQIQLNDSLPQDFGSLTRELNQTRKQLSEKDDELQELKAERNNTRLLLEHLECLVSRHERGLRMTVAKRQSRTPAGVSSEVEVLKALKSLFEHHKALDEKVREKLRVSLERVNQLEEELVKAQEEIARLKSNSNADGRTVCNGDLNESKFKLSVTESEVQEMKTLIEKQSNELFSSRSKLQELTTKFKELEDQAALADSQVLQIKDENTKLRDLLRENKAQQEDQEERISTLEKRYLNAQRECTSIHDVNEKLEHELQNKEAHLKLADEKLCALAEKLELNEQKLTQMELSKKQEAQAKEIQAANESQNASQSQEHQMSLEERIARLENQLEEKNNELHRSRQREKMNEEHNQRLSSTVDKLLAESNERLQLHLKERMAALEEKNSLIQDLDKVRKSMDEAQNDRQKAHLEQTKLRAELESLRQELQSLKNEQVQPLMNSNIGRTNKKSAVLSYHEREWDKMEHHLMNSHLPTTYEASESELSHVEDGTANGMYHNQTVDSFLASPTRPNEAQALALMLQEQLDAINNEIRLIQEEKQSTEQRAEELESQVVSIESPLGLMRTRKYEPQHLIGISPPQSGRSSPRTMHLSNSREYLNSINPPTLPETTIGNIYATQHHTSHHPPHLQHPHYMQNSIEDPTMTNSYDESNAVRLLKLRQPAAHIENPTNTYATTVPPDVLPR